MLERLHRRPRLEEPPDPPQPTDRPGPWLASGDAPARNDTRRPWSQASPQPHRFELLPEGNLRDRELAEFFDDSIGRIVDRVHGRLDGRSHGSGQQGSLLAIAEGLDQQVSTLRVKLTQRAGWRCVRGWPTRRGVSSAA